MWNGRFPGVWVEEPEVAAIVHHVTDRRRPRARESFDRRVRDYYSTHTPEHPSDPIPSTSQGNWPVVAPGTVYPPGPYPVLPKAFDISSDPFYLESKKRDGTYVFTREEVRGMELPRQLKRSLKIYEITHVTSPTQFYMIEVTTAREDTRYHHRNVPGWWREMQKFYNYPVSDLLMQYAPYPEVRGLFVLWCPESQSWERGRILDVNLDNRTCYLFYIDFGIFTVRPWKDCKELLAEWKQPNPLVMAGKLQHVYPTTFINGVLFNSNLPEPVDHPSELWTGASIAFMKTHAQGKFFYGINVPDKSYVVTKTKGVLELCPRDTTKLGMVLVEVSLKSGRSLNAELCLNAHAICTGMGASSAFQFPNGSKLYDDLNDADNQQRFTASFAESLMQYLGWTLPSEEPTGPYQPKIDNANDYVVWVSHGLVDKEVGKDLPRIPEVVRKNVNSCDITIINSPSCFYILPAWKVPALKVLTEFLTSKMDGGDKSKENEFSTPVPSHEICIGMPIMLNYNFEQNTFLRGHQVWCRAIVKDVLIYTELVKAILVDFGIELTVHMLDVFAMPSLVQRVPGFCFRAHLNIPNHKPYPQNFWTTASTEFLASRLESLVLEDDPFCFYIWESYPKNRIDLEMFNEELTLAIDGTGTWEKVSDHIVIQNAGRSQLPFIAGHDIHNDRPLKWINTPQFETLCGSLFTSIGVNFSFEAEEFQGQGAGSLDYYQLRNATAILAEGNHIERLAELDRKKLQAQIGEKIRVLKAKAKANQSLCKYVQPNDYEPL